MQGPLLLGGALRALDDVANGIAKCIEIPSKNEVFLMLLL